MVAAFAALRSSRLFDLRFAAALPIRHLLSAAALPFAARAIRTPPRPLLRFQLDAVRLNDGGNQARKSFLDFLAARSVMHFDSAPFASHQARFPERFEMLGERRFRDRFFADPEKIRAVLGTL